MIHQLFPASLLVNPVRLQMTRRRLLAMSGALAVGATVGRTASVHAQASPRLLPSPLRSL